MEDSSYYYDFHQTQGALYSSGKTPTRPNGSSQTEREEEENLGAEFQSREGKKASTYYWNDLQNKKYIKFLKEQGYLLLLPPSERKAKKVNLLMSRKVRTRNSTQCHTHHQKMMGKHGTIEHIISYYEGLFQAKRKNLGEASPRSLEEKSVTEIKDSENTSFQAQKPIMESELISEPTPIWTACNLGGEKFEEYFEFEESILMEWIDW